jgi:hypothetical protein
MFTLDPGNWVSPGKTDQSLHRDEVIASGHGDRSSSARSMELRS